MTQSLPVIFGCSGPELTPEEERFFREVRPCGFIVFRRNCVSREQLRRLATQLRATIDDAHAPIQIDQEGGRVLRLRAPEWWEAPAAGAIGSAYDGDPERAVRAAELVGRIIGLQLSDVGVTVDCAPCVDLRYPFGHSVIGDRAFHADPKAVTRLGRAFADGLASAGVQATIKHLPGHGRALVDSHLDLPVISSSLAALDATDFVPFKALRDVPWGIVSHIQFTEIDSRPATLSPTVIAEIVRGRIGFGGILITDDISMQALKAPVAESSREALAAGCDLVVHCNGRLDEMRAIAAAIEPMGDGLAARIERIKAPPAAGAAVLEFVERFEREFGDLRKA